MPAEGKGGANDRHAARAGYSANCENSKSRGANNAQVAAYASPRLAQKSRTTMMTLTPADITCRIAHNLRRGREDAGLSRTGSPN